MSIWVPEQTRITGYNRQREKKIDTLKLEVTDWGEWTYERGREKLFTSIRSKNRPMRQIMHMHMRQINRPMRIT